MQAIRTLAPLIVMTIGSNLWFEGQSFLGWLIIGVAVFMQVVVTNGK